MKKETNLVYELSRYLYGRKIWLYKYTFLNGLKSYYFTDNNKFPGGKETLVYTDNGSKDCEEVVGVINKITAEASEWEGDSISMEVEVEGKLVELSVISITDIFFLKK